MALPLGSSIETQITDGPTLVSQMNNNVQAIQSVVQDVPQIQTVLTDNVVNVSSIINAPFVEVTSVNGMTGDVQVEPIIEDFQANHYYLKNTMISYNGQIYWAKNTFTSGSSFNASDWNAVSISISTAWNDITGKPNFATVATSGSYNDLIDKPSVMAGLTEMSYGESNAWAKFIAAYQAKQIVYCRASSNSNPATGTQGRKAFMAYVNNVDTPTEVEFQYVRSVSSKTSSQPVDQVFVYKLTNASGGTWTVETRNMAAKVAAGTNVSVSYASGTYTISATQPTVPTKTSDLTNDSSFVSVTSSNVDIGEGAVLAANTLYGVYID